MPPFPPEIAEKVLDDFVTSTMRKIAKKEPRDLVTPRNPLFKRLESREVGGIVEENPGQPVVRDLQYAVADRDIELSRTQRVQTRNYTPEESFTSAQFEYGMCLSTLTVDMYTYENVQTPEALVNYMERAKRVKDRSHRNKQVGYLWDGRTIGTTPIFGLKDAIRFTPTSDPARGAIGRVSVSDLPQWTNKSANYNDNFLAYDSGAEIETFLDNGSNSLLSLYFKCSERARGEGPEGQPDLIACNEAYFRCCHRMVSKGLMFRDNKDRYKLGVDGFVFQNAVIFEDPNVPDDPNNSTYGVAMLLNSRSFDVVYTKGIRNRWGNTVTLQGDTAIAIDKVTQMTVAYDDLGELGIHYGVIPTVDAGGS